MATAYTSNRATSTQAAKSRTGVVFDDCTFALSAALVINDTVKLFKIPKGAKVLDFKIAFPILDSNVSPACVVDVGDSASATTYVSGSTKGSHFSAAYIMSMVVDGVPASFRTSYSSADDYLQIKIATAPATGETTGTINASIQYQMDDEVL